jgi:hypothetical protein
VERVVRGWRWVDRQAEAREAALRHARRGLRLDTDTDGMVVVRGRLPPEVGALLQRALDAARERLYPPIPRPAPPPAAPERSRGDVSAETPEPRSRGNVSQAEERFSGDAPALADPAAPGQSVLDGGERVPAETSRRLGCDASRVVMRHDGQGRLVEIGARTRTLPPGAPPGPPGPGPGLPLPGL